MTMTTSPCLRWETAWAEYVDALTSYDADWSGENFVEDIARCARRLADAKRQLRAIDPIFCKMLGI